MNIEKITYKIVKDSIKEDDSCTDFVLKMILSYLSDEQRGTVMDEIVNEREHILFSKGDIIAIDIIGNRYDLKDLYEDDRMKDANLMTKDGYIKAIILKDCSYSDTCNPFATEYMVNIDYYNKTQKLMQKELRVKRSNIISLWKGLE